MSDKRTYSCSGARPVLVGVFEAVLQRLESGPPGVSARVLSLFAVSLLTGEPFDLVLIESLPTPADRDLCLDLFVFCIEIGLSEDDRRAALSAFEPYALLHAPGSRH